MYFPHVSSVIPITDISKHLIVKKYRFSTNANNKNFSSLEKQAHQLDCIAYHLFFCFLTMLQIFIFFIG